jgi:hypothetical protein
MAGDHTSTESRQAASKRPSDTRGDIVDSQTQLIREMARMGKSVRAIASEPKIEAKKVAETLKGANDKA